VNDEAQARELAAASIERQSSIRIGQTTELRDGWYFALAAPRVMIGSNGLIVNKRTGRVLHLGSAFPVERDLAMYDRGYQYARYTLTVTAVNDLDCTTKTLGALRLMVVIPEAVDGVVWRVPRLITAAEHRDRLRSLPYAYADVSLYFGLELLENVRAKRWFTFEISEFVSSPDR